MTIDTKSRHITPADGNIFADLGFEPEEAARLQAEAQRSIARRREIKERLMKEVALWIKVKKLKQEEAARILEVTRPRVSDVVNQKAEKFTIDALIEMVNHTGKEVLVSVV